ncbi:hypothetical protein LXT21_11070 [Myxococcus sp. K38C18041901]|uniref:hypothetical protein n=1 Tax=Myxococcus guangdongensis TaxID=2906760 RepID=UPI0020A7F53F|nr:hypothetical protein [Myxococcus guangdongensis]MCP3059314.1 hypothetical protein [Myxococcus guangdongensis]
MGPLVISDTVGPSPFPRLLVDRSPSLRLRLVLLCVSVGLCACEPIIDPEKWRGVRDGGDTSLGSGRDGGGEPDAGDDAGRPPLMQDAGPDAGGDGGEADGGGLSPPDDAGTDGGTPDAGDAGGWPGNPDGPVLSDAGVDVRMSDWSACEQGWQKRNLLPQGTKGYAHFALDAEGDAYLIEFTDDIVRVPTTKPWRTFPRTGFVGPPPWPGGIRVDAAGEVHVALSPQFAESATDVPTHFFRYTAGRWVETRTASGLVKSLELDSRGQLHALSMWIGAEHRLMYTHGPPGALVVEDTGLRALDRAAYVDLKVDGQGKAHLVYEGVFEKRIHYATNASGTWVSEVVAEAWGDPYLALSPSGVPHVGWSSGGGTWVSARDGQGVWSTSLVTQENTQLDALRVGASGEVHVLTIWRDGPLSYWTRTPEGWAKTTLLAHEGPGNRSFVDAFLELDAQQRAHVMLTSVFTDFTTEPRPLRRVDYFRQCP